MPLYQYEGITPQGEHKSGTIDSPSRMLANLQLRQQGLRVRTLVEARVRRGRDGSSALDNVRASLWHPVGPARPVPPGALADFYAQLSQLLGAGATVHDAAHALQDRGHPRLRKVLEEVTPALAEGESLTENLARYPEIFPPYVLAMVRVGETSGNLDQLCAAISSQYADEEWLRLRLKVSTIYYRIFLWILGLLVSTFPWMISQGFGWYLHQFLTIFLPVLVGIGVLIMAGKVVLGKTVADDIIYRLPFLAPFGLRAARARLLTCLHVLMRAGVDLPSALTLAAPAVGLRPMQVQLQVAAERIRGQEPVRQALQDCGALSERAKAALTTAQQSGLYKESLERLAARAVGERGAVIRKMATVGRMGSLIISAIIVVIVLCSGYKAYFRAILERAEELMP